MGRLVVLTIISIFLVACKEQDKKGAPRRIPLAQNNIAWDTVPIVAHSQEKPPGTLWPTFGVMGDVGTINIKGIRTYSDSCVESTLDLEKVGNTLTVYIEYKRTEQGACMQVMTEIPYHIRVKNLAEGGYVVKVSESKEGKKIQEIWSYKVNVMKANEPWTPLKGLPEK